MFIPGNTAVENVRKLAQSALPDAPVVPDEPTPPRELRIRVAAFRMLWMPRVSRRLRGG